MPGSEIIDEKEKNAISKLFSESGILVSTGNKSQKRRFYVRELEKKFARKMKCKFALAVTSGTAAIKIGLKALGVKHNDEVITQAFNFIATIEAIIDLGAKPILVDVDKTLNMCPESLLKRINKKTKAIIPVHMLGVPVDMSEIMRIAKKKKIPVLEDNCEAIGGKYKKKFLGTIGDVGALSFDGGKIITCGEGGMVLTNNAKIIKYSKEYHDHGHENNPKLPRGRDTRKIVGFNYRITEMQGAVAQVQLGKLDKILSENKKRYFQLEKSLKNYKEMRKIPKGSEIIYDTFIFFVKNKFLRNKIIKLLKKEKIGTKNLPDAVEWHCAFYWKHALNKSEINKIVKTKKILDTAIAIPILLKRDIRFYSQLGNKLKKILFN